MAKCTHCANELIASQCKVVCMNCGQRQDCSDLAVERVEKEEDQWDITEVTLRDAIDSLYGTLKAKELEIQSLRNQDNPDNDNTDFAHPAYWRGQDYAVKQCCKMVRSVLEGVEPSGNVCPELQNLLVRIHNIISPKG